MPTTFPLTLDRLLIAAKAGITLFKDQAPRSEERSKQLIAEFAPLMGSLDSAYFEHFPAEVRTALQAWWVQGAQALRLDDNWSMGVLHLLTVLQATLWRELHGAQMGVLAQALYQELCAIWDRQPSSARPRAFVTRRADNPHTDPYLLVAYRQPYSLEEGLWLEHASLSRLWSWDAVLQRFSVVPWPHLTYAAQEA